MSTREFDVVVYGASGYTGRLVAEYLAERCAAGLVCRWAMAGRSQSKLEAVRDEIGAPSDTPLVVADAADPASVQALAARAKVMLTTVGPYQLYGGEVVAACVEAGTDYVDLCGEVPFMRATIDAHEARAKETGARIVFSTGFDSVPFDLGVLFLQNASLAQRGKPFPRVKGRVRSMNGTFSGGTLASGMATMAAAQKDPQVLQLLLTPWALTPGFEGPAQPSGNDVHEDPALGAWVAPFVMAAINTRNIHRSNQLLGHPYGVDFAYDEMMVAGPGDSGKQMAEALASTNMMAVDENSPKPGEGPSKEERDNGNYDVLFVGEDADGGSLRAAVTGDKDPGYGSTSKMIAESALCLIEDVPALPGGVYTPAAAGGTALIERLKTHAGLTFALEA